MHIPDGILSGSPAGIGVLAAGAAVAAAGTILGLRRMDYERVPQVALLSAAFFVASLIRVPFGPTSVHLLLTGLMGLMLGWTAFPAILVALVLQAMFFQFGGLTTLGVNTMTMAFPAVLCYLLFRRAAGSRHDVVGASAGFAAGAFGFALSALAFSGVLLAGGSEFKALAQTLLVVHLPVALAEGAVSAFVIVLLRRVRPELLRAPLLAAAPAEGCDG